VNRRTAVGGIATALLVAWFRADAQAVPKRAVVGFLSNLSLRDTKWSLDALRQGLEQLGYVDGRNISIDVRYADGKPERLAMLAAELVAAKPDVVVTAGPQAAHALQKATRSLPVVLAVVSDPVGDGLVASLSHPGGNITGLAFQNLELTAKRLQLLRDVLPQAHQIAVLSDVTMGHGAGEREALDAAAALGFNAKVYSLQGAAEFEAAFQDIHRDKAEGLVVLASPMLNANRKLLLQFIAHDRLPATYEVRAFVDDGGLMSYGPSFAAMYLRSATYVDKILRGAKPEDLAMEQPAKFELVVNMQAAREIGLTVPQSLLLRADDVIR